jgi:type IV pilus assembly protein PilB
MRVIDQLDLDAAFKESQEKSFSFIEILFKGGLITDRDLGRLMSEIFTVPFVELQKETIKDDVLKIIPQILAKKQKIIAFKNTEAELCVATSNPSNIQVIESIEKKIEKPVKVYYATDNDVRRALNLYLSDVQSEFTEMIKDYAEEAEKSTGQAKEPPVIKLVSKFLSYAVIDQASDIHIEPMEKKSLLRFRIDGILQDIVELPIKIHPLIVSRLKVLAKLKIDEHQQAQDGKFQHKDDEMLDNSVDIRVSIVPVTNGSKVVMRLLSEENRRFSLTDLGFSQDNLKKISSAYKKPYGMILSTGPTGSGKTTTQYAILKELNQPGINIMTIEDPVEYDMERINQIQVNHQTGLDFSHGLKSIVRQDPDVILVGEIRDNETAEIALNSAMTGHLVLSTLHTNDAATSFPRLVDLGVKPFLVASTINLVVAQRLIRRLCPNCRYSTEVEKADVVKEFSLSDDSCKLIFNDKDKARVYEAKGCDLCNHTGYIGRVVVAEVMEINEAIKDAIMSEKDAGEISKLAQENGMKTMLEDGLMKVKQGITTIEEIFRMVKES